jgi:Dolichyl-phosphate-mannose-protein mannosyltransferase
VLASPVVLYAVLRLRGMAPPQLPDPGIHTGFIVDPHALFARYHDFLTPTARFREAARVGFLVPARLMYLLFGAVPGFYAFRYLLALIAIGPLYLLLRQSYGRWAGFIGIAVVMSSPVVITAWGTDYPDSAAVAYLTGGLAAFALTFTGEQRRPGWLVAATGLVTMAVWSHGVSVPLAAALFVAYVGVRLRRKPAHLGGDLALVAASAIVVTLLLGIASALLLGQFDFITPTVQSATELSSASEVRLWHSASWRWVLYDNYLLVPPAILASFLVVFARTKRRIGTSQLYIGLALGLQVATLAYLQFFGTFWGLEIHYMSSPLWSSVNITLAIIVAELARPMMIGLGPAERSRTSAAEPLEPRKGAARWVACGVPALIVLAVALAYEADPHVPAMTWPRGGLAIAAILLAAAVVGRLAIAWAHLAANRRSGMRLAAGYVLSLAAITVVTGAALVLTVAPGKPHRPLAGTVAHPQPDYAQALGGSDAVSVDRYAVDSELPGFVGGPAYRNELLLTWAPRTDFGPLQGAMGIYHNRFLWVSRTFPVLGKAGARKIERLHVAQVLFMSLSGKHFAEAVRTLAPYQPVVVRRAILAHGSFHLHAWLVDLRRYLRRTPS